MSTQEIMEAIEAGDFARVAELQAEVTARPARERVERLQEIHAELTELQAELTTKLAKAAELRKVTKEKLAAKEAAEKALMLADRDSSSAAVAAGIVRERIRNLHNEQGRILSEVSGYATAMQAPVVRSLPHGPAVIRGRLR